MGAPGTIAGVTEEFRCSAASLREAEPMAGTAPSERVWLFVEEPGPTNGDIIKGALAFWRGQ